MEKLTPMGGDMVMAYWVGPRKGGARLTQAIAHEFARNGRRTLSRGKLRWIMRQIRKRRSG